MPNILYIFSYKYKHLTYNLYGFIIQNKPQKTFTVDVFISRYISSSPLSPHYLFLLFGATVPWGRGTEERSFIQPFSSKDKWIFSKIVKGLSILKQNKLTRHRLSTWEALRSVFYLLDFAGTLILNPPTC